MDFIVAALAVFWAWELLLVISPLSPPPAIQPVLVAACALGAGVVPEPYLGAAAIAGAVALLHRVVAVSPTVVQRARTRGLPPL